MSSIQLEPCRSSTVTNVLNVNVNGCWAVDETLLNALRLLSALKGALNN